MERIEQKFFTRTENRKLKDIKAIVIHWPGAKTTGLGEFLNMNIDSLWGWMDAGSMNSYHFLIQKNRIIQARDTALRAIHCGHETYRKKAKDFFGYDVCSSSNSPNNYTLAVCMVHDNSSGGYHAETVDTAVDLIARLCIDNNLSPDSDLWRHSDITSEKKIPCPRAFFEDDDGEGADDLWNSFKYWIAKRITAIYEEEHIKPPTKCGKCH